MFRLPGSAALNGVIIGAVCVFLAGAIIGAVVF
jgi:hypothetical protein